MEYTLIRSRRRTVALEVTPDLRVIVRAPIRMPQREIDAFFRQNRAWLRRALERTEKRKKKEEAIELNEAELRKRAKEYLPKQTDHWAEIMGLSPASVRITSAKTRFGSCSPKNRICYSWRLMAYPTEAIDYVIVHELAHVLQKNHSEKFYAVVQRYLPDWKKRRELLKQ
ncbi:MAG: M48 family metallopeptidase [Clostridia bacterium]|nr:M48 family metallopeptidase [Clostridia bacterium]